MVASVTDDPETVAAWLHDVVEDTPVTIEDVERQFGAGVRARVDELTDVSRPQDGNRAAHKALDLAQLTTAPPRAQIVKLADLINDCQDICRRNPRFGCVFVAEMAAVLDVLGAGDAVLMKRARGKLDKLTPRVAAAGRSVSRRHAGGGAGRRDPAVAPAPRREHVHARPPRRGRGRIAGQLDRSHRAWRDQHVWTPG
jgi:hypothetical protein